MLSDRLDSKKPSSEPSTKHIITEIYSKKLNPWFSGGLQVTLKESGDKIDFTPSSHSI
jgi:two-component system LytT family response regulator